MISGFPLTKRYPRPSLITKGSSIKEVSFCDVRAEPLTEVELAELIGELGVRSVDRQSNDYLALNDWLKNSEADAQISARPKVMARPVIIAAREALHDVIATLGQRSLTHGAVDGQYALRGNLH